MVDGSDKSCRSDICRELPYLKKGGFNMRMKVEKTVNHIINLMFVNIMKGNSRKI